MSTKQHYLALDGLRGVAAMAVLVMHRGRWFYPPGGFLGHGYLAVDFFFLLSGFVIAFAYDERVAAGLTARRFMALRLIRLYPLIFLGMLLGAVWPLIRILTHGGGAPGPGGLAYDLGRGLLLIPDDYAPGPGDSIFPLNGPTWSLLFELLANLAYAVIGPRLRLKPLIAVVAASAACLAWLAFHGGVDVGGRPSVILGGLPRTGFGFFGGVLLYRVMAILRAKGFSAPALPAPFLTTAVLLVAVLATPSHYHWNPYFDLAALMLAFPALIALASGPGAKWEYGAAMCRLAGDLSYPLYVLHYPLLVLIGGVGFQLAGLDMPTPWRGIVAAAIVAAAAWAALKFYDEPVRRRLMLGVKPRAVAAVA